MTANNEVKTSRQHLEIKRFSSIGGDHFRGDYVESNLGKLLNNVPKLKQFLFVGLINSHLDSWSLCTNKSYTDKMPYFYCRNNYDNNTYTSEVNFRNNNLFLAQLLDVYTTLLFRNESNLTIDIDNDSIINSWNKYHKDLLIRNIAMLKEQPSDQ